jgi:hypothetical protein
MTARLEQDAPEWLTAKQAAERIGISTRSLNRYQADGLISPEYLPRGYRRFRAADVDALLGVAESGQETRPTPVGQVIDGDRASAAPPRIGAGQQSRTDPTVSHH